MAANEGLQPQSAAAAAAGDVESARCYCCGLTEECTAAYIARVRERHDGFWICGLCSEAVKDEVVRSRSGGGIGVDEAMRRHVRFCQQFRSSSPPASPGEELISAVKQILRRSLDHLNSPRKEGGCRPLGRSKSCFATVPESPNE